MYRTGLVRNLIRRVGAPPENLQTEILSATIYGALLVGGRHIDWGVGLRRSSQPFCRAPISDGHLVNRRFAGGPKWQTIPNAQQYLLKSLNCRNSTPKLTLRPFTWVGREKKRLRVINATPNSP